MQWTNQSDHAVPVNGQTAMSGPSNSGFGVRLLLYFLVFGLIAVTCLAGWRWVQCQIARQTSQVEPAPVKAMLVVNAAGDVVDAPSDQFIGRNVLLMIPASERAETRDKMAKQRRVQVETDLGQTELVRTPEGRWLGVVR